MARIDPDKAEHFAKDVVRKLRASGFEALWAGGCVRDRLRGERPKDYDVATSATPDQIREVFGRRRTIAMGAAFGVITVLGPRHAGQIEVATFRQDATYSDGRHPDRVSFSNAKEDALRRDFTINGLFFDPIDGKVIDYVNGQQDLERKVLRAIGDPHARFAEDRLRLLRAIRFAAALGFEIDATTLSAIRENAEGLIVVSAERISGELRQMLVDPNRRRAIEMLAETRLLEIILPEIDTSGDDFDRALAVLEKLQEPTFAVALAALLRRIYLQSRTTSEIEQIGKRWRLAKDEVAGAKFCLEHERAVREATRTPWPRLQRILIAPRAVELLTYCEAIASLEKADRAAIEFCQAKLALPPDELNPPPLITGEDLKQAGIPPGNAYRHILHAVRDAQLLGEISSAENALSLAQQLWGSSSCS